jgi:glycosyltransferase involved in cell wall biosynthesis
MPIQNPKISVILPLYNAEKYIVSAINSILNQTFNNFELLVIDDGSTDHSLQIARSVVDPRIKIFENPKNLGLSDTLNRGFKISSGEYIARMDQDDLAAPERLEKQLQFLKNNSNIDLIGTAFHTFGSKLSRKIQNPVSHDEIKAALMFDSAFAHPTVMYRKKSFQKHSLEYDSNFNRAEDFELWTRCISFLNTANLPEVLLHYRIHSAQTSIASTTKQRDLAKKIRALYLNRLNISLTTKEQEIHEKIADWNFNFLSEDLQTYQSWLAKMNHMQPGLNKHLTYRATAAYYTSASKSVRKILIDLKLFNPSQFSFKEKAFYLTKKIYNKLKS